MSIQDKIAKRLLGAHTRMLGSNGNLGWFTKRKIEIESMNADVIRSHAAHVVFNTGATLICEIADSDQAKAVGLQKYASIPDGCGMLFPFNNETVSFHMGTVNFNLDLIFVGDDSRVTRIVANVEPGTRGSWGMPHTSAVVEAVGGYARANKIEVGTSVDIKIGRQAQETFPSYPRKDINPKMVPSNPTEDRFKGHDLPDKILEDQQADPANYDSQIGWDQSSLGDDSISPIRPLATKK